MISTIAAIGAGGAIGAILRHGTNVAAVHMLGHGFPYATIFVNVMGSFLMGVLIATLAHFWTPSESIKLFLTTGLLGAFTTFSTFSLDFVTLWERGEIILAGGYAILSVVLAIGALVLGLILVKGIAA